MTCEIDLLKAILKELKIISDKVISRTNTHIYVNVDTSLTTEQIIDLQQKFGVRKANDLTVSAVGGGFTLSKNGETKQSASLDLSFEDEDIYTIQWVGTGVAGTGTIRIGAYIPKD